jgi:hypothetical protein
MESEWRENNRVNTDDIISGLTREGREMARDIVRSIDGRIRYLSKSILADHSFNNGSYSPLQKIKVFHILRLQLYVAALCHAYSTATFELLDLPTDLKKAVEGDMTKLMTNSDTACNNTSTLNKIESLFDLADSRILDIALLGLDSRHSSINEALEVVVNCFYIEIVNAFGVFFSNASISLKVLLFLFLESS